MGPLRSPWVKWRAPRAEDRLTAPAYPALGIGDPMPAISLPSHTGPTLSLHHPTLAGQPTVLLATERLDPAATTALAAFAREQQRFAAIGVRLLAMTGETAADNAAAAAAHGVRFPVLSDGPGYFLAALGVPGRVLGKPADAIADCRIFIVDRGVRIVERLWCNDAQAQAAAVVSLCERMTALPPSSPAIVTAQAPVLLVPRVFPEEFCRRLIDHWAAADKQDDVAGGYFAAGANQPVDPSARRPTVKRRSDWLIPQGPIHDEISRLLSRRVSPELLKAFDFRAETFEQLRLGCYDAASGGYFRRHRDNIGPPEIRRRRFAMSLNLNDDYEGGEVHFPEYGDQLYRPPTGCALLFSCSLLHEAKDIRSGRRFVLVTFFFGPVPPEPRRPEGPAASALS